MKSFTKYKFLRLDTPLRHKKCAEILRDIYEKQLDQKDFKQQIQEYEKLISWIEEIPMKEYSLSVLSERYHAHLKKANIVLKEHNLLPRIRRGDRDPICDFGNCHLYLDNLRSAYNVGSILRTTEALRLGKIYFGKNTPFIDNAKVQKTSMGSYEMVPCEKLEDLSLLPKPIIILDTASDAISVSDFIFPDSFTLVVGNEEFGVSDELLEMADYLVDIPLFGQKNSINVACAFGICAQAIRKQWNRS